MRLLITGGAGYIGSHVVLAALDRGYEVTVFDDLSTGLEENININTNFVKGSTCSKSDLSNLFSIDTYDGIIHLAASKASGESMLKHQKYSKNNVNSIRKSSQTHPNIIPKIDQKTAGNRRKAARF